MIKIKTKWSRYVIKVHPAVSVRIRRAMYPVRFKGSRRVHSILISVICRTTTPRVKLDQKPCAQRSGLFVKGCDWDKGGRGEGDGEISRGDGRAPGVPEGVPAPEIQELRNETTAANQRPDLFIGLSSRKSLIVQCIFVSSADTSDGYTDISGRGGQGNRGGGRGI